MQTQIATCICAAQTNYYVGSYSPRFSANYVLQLMGTRKFPEMSSNLNKCRISIEKVTDT